MYTISALYTVKKNFLWQPASADFWVLSTYFCITIKTTSWENKKKTAEAGSLKCYVGSTVFFLQCTKWLIWNVIT